MLLADRWFNDWQSVGVVAVVAVVVYAALVVFLRLGGKRTLSQFTVFDWVVTVALGSTVATTIVSPSVAVAEGLAALGMLILLQTAVAFVSTRSHGAERLVKGEPTLLAHRGELLRDAMRRERVGEDAVRQALREAGVSSLDEAAAVVLETNGKLTVLESRGGALPG